MNTNGQESPAQTPDFTKGDLEKERCMSIDGDDDIQS